LDVTVRSPTGGREVTATGLGLYQSCVGKVTSFTIETLGRPGKEFDVVISGPQGNAVPVRCYQHRDGNLLAEFTTNSVGKIRNNLFTLMRVKCRISNRNIKIKKLLTFNLCIIKIKLFFAQVHIKSTCCTERNRC